MGLMGLRALPAVAVAALVLAAVAGGTAVPLGSLSDSFDDPATASRWQAMDGDLQDGVAPRFDIDKTTSGELTIVPGRSWWVHRERAFALLKPVTGDFVVTLKIRVSGKESALPTANWSLSGLLIRRATTDRARENWLAFRIGRVDEVDVFERKTTVNGTSVLKLSPAPTGWVELRVARVGSRFLFLRRPAGGTWQHHWSYVRTDLPRSLLVGVDSFSGYEDTKADLVSHVDYVKFASTGVPGTLRKSVLAGRKSERILLPYLKR
jgi:hypothetical protein